MHTFIDVERRIRRAGIIALGVAAVLFALLAYTYWKWPETPRAANRSVPSADSPAVPSGLLP